MNTSNKWKSRSIGIKIMMGLVLAVMFGTLDAAPAFARNDHDHDREYRHDGGRHDNRGRKYYRDRHGRRMYRTTVYRERVYVPPPVIYAPPPPPGISIFFPSITIR